MSYGRHAGKAPVPSVLSAPTAIGTLPDWLVYENAAPAMYGSTSTGFTGAEIVYSLTAGATGVSIDAGSGVLTTDPATIAVQSATTLTVQATNGSGSVTQNVSLTVANIRRNQPTVVSRAVQRASSW